VVSRGDDAPRPEVATVVGDSAAGNGGKVVVGCQSGRCGSGSSGYCCWVLLVMMMLAEDATEVDECCRTDAGSVRQVIELISRQIHSVVDVTVYDLATITANNTLLSLRSSCLVRLDLV
jgi:hypothetical protein